MKNRRGLEKINRIYDYIVYGCFGLFLFFSVLSSINLFVKLVWDRNALLISFITTLTILVTFSFALNNVLKKALERVYGFFSGISARPGWVVFLIIIVLPLVIKILIIAFCKMPVTDESDIGIYIKNAAELYKYGEVRTHSEYSLRYPHIFWMGVLLKPLQCFGKKYIVYQIFYTIAGGMMTWLFYKALKRLISGPGALMITFIYAYMPSTLFSCMAITHEYVFRFGMVVVLWMFSFIATLKKRKCIPILWAALGILFGLFAKINLMTIVILIAVFIMLVRCTEVKLWRRMLICVVLVLPIVTLNRLSPKYEAAHVKGNGVVNTKSYGWTILIGANTESGGRFSDNDFELIDDYVLATTGEEEYDNVVFGVASVVLAGERWNNLLKQPGKCIRFLAEKFSVVWAGSHYSIEYVSLYQDGVKRLLCLGLMGINNIIYLTLSIVSLVSFAKSGRRMLARNRLLCLSCTVVLGIAFVLLWTEIMNKYNLTALLALYMSWGLSVVPGDVENENIES